MLEVASAITPSETFPNGANLHQLRLHSRIPECKKAYTHILKLSPVVSMPCIFVLSSFFFIAQLRSTFFFIRIISFVSMMITRLKKNVSGVILMILKGDSNDYNGRLSGSSSTSHRCHTFQKTRRVIQNLSGLTIVSYRYCKKNTMIKRLDFIYGIVHDRNCQYFMFPSEEIVTNLYRRYSVSQAREDQRDAVKRNGRPRKRRRRPRRLRLNLG